MTNLKNAGMGRGGWGGSSKCWHALTSYLHGPWRIWWTYLVLAGTIYHRCYLLSHSLWDFFCFSETFWLSFIHYSTYLQGVPQYCIHFYFLITRLPRGLEIPSWTFFNSPFPIIRIKRWRRAFTHQNIPHKDIGTSMWHSSWSPFGRSTGND